MRNTCWTARDETGEVYAISHQSMISFEDFCALHNRPNVICSEMDVDQAGESAKRWPDAHDDLLRAKKPQVEMNPNLPYLTDDDPPTEDIITVGVNSRLQFSATRSEAESVFMALARALYPTGQGRVETIVFECGNPLPEWLTQAHINRKGFMGMRIRTMAMGDVVASNRKALERIGELVDQMVEMDDYEDAMPIKDQIDEIISNTV